MLQFDGKEEKSLIRLLESLAEWYPRAPQLQGNLSLIARVERDLPIVYAQIEKNLPFEVPENTDKIPTKLPIRKGNEFIHQGEDFTWENAPPDGVTRTYEEGQKLPILPFEGVSHDGQAKDFLDKYWKPWLEEANLLTQSDLRGDKGLDNQLFSSLSNKYRSSGKEDRTQSGGTPLRDILPDRKSHNTSNLERLQERPDFEPTRKEVLKVNAVKNRR